ncbi:MAG: hypothetical protein JWN18_74 [Parcubacteria group bacterium]|nr:hypothetical protein [Parcubacteria group bacterium]
MVKHPKHYPLLLTFLFVPLAFLFLLVLLRLPQPSATYAAATKFIPTFLVYYGGGPALSASDASKLAKFDLIDIDRYRYNQINGNTWTAIKSLNPASQIYLYEIGPETTNYEDSYAPVSLNNISRFDASRSHPMGSLNGSHPELFLTDGAGRRVYSSGFSNPAANQYSYLMDFGSSAYQSYWLTATKNDVIDQPWAADGIFADNCVTFASAGGYNAASSKYSTDAVWSTAMNAFSSGIAAGLHGYGQKLWCNKGDTKSAAGSAAWLALDASTNHPDVLLEEGAFAVMWGSAVQFFPEALWKQQVDTIAATKNSKVALMSHTQLSEGGSGIDNWGKPVTYWQALWYSMGSFLLAKNDVLNNAYFMFNGGSGYDKIWYYDEYDAIDLGKALGSYATSSVSGVTIYSREFEKGYVVVNPTVTDVASWTVPQTSKQLTHANFLSPLSTIPSVTSIALPGHTSTLLMKTTLTPPSDTVAPSVPSGLVATSVLPTQVTLSWNSSTDNVGVIGYYVYLNDAPLATTSTTTIKHIGLTPNTTYTYRVSAYDAVPLHSDWTPIPLSITTPAIIAPPDRIPPSAPTGLTATVVSPTQINLSWNASTDNVGVTSYRINRGTSELATVSPSTMVYQDLGLTPVTTYVYTVQALDAANNVSSPSSSLTAVTLALPDTTPPSVPTGLTGVAASSTQITLSWNASTDNVGVTGYYVYLNDVPLATTTMRSYSHKGLTPNKTYVYRVSAYDAVPLHSDWTPIPLSITTPAIIAPPDTTPPSVPTGLIGVAASSTQVNLSWNASTDNVGVTGYNVYLNDVKLVTTGGTSFSHKGLTPGTSYSYRISAYDVMGNTSSLTATPLTISTPNPVPLAAFKSGDKIQTTSSIKVRVSPSTSAKSAGTQPTVALGTIVGGPSTQDGYTWWSVNFDSGADGWVVENYLVKQKFKLGDRLQTNTSVSVKTSPAGKTAYGNQGTGIQGTIIGGPVSQSLHIWWQVDFATAPDGWVSEEGITLLSPIAITKPTVVSGSTNLAAVATATEGSNLLVQLWALLVALGSALWSLISGLFR